MRGDNQIVVHTYNKSNVKWYKAKSLFINRVVVIIKFNHRLKIASWLQKRNKKINMKKNYIKLTSANYLIIKKK